MRSGWAAAYSSRSAERASWPRAVQGSDSESPRARVLPSLHAALHHRPGAHRGIAFPAAAVSAVAALSLLAQDRPLFPAAAALRWCRCVAVCLAQPASAAKCSDSDEAASASVTVSRHHQVLSTAKVLRVVDSYFDSCVPPPPPPHTPAVACGRPTNGSLASAVHDLTTTR
jgi:hypothetical protein